MRRGDLARSDAGVAPLFLPFLIAVLVGGVLAGLASLAVVSLGSTGSTTPITAPLVTYDSGS